MFSDITFVFVLHNCQMASKVHYNNGVYFFIFDFFIMQDSSDSNDVLPKAITYFYPPDEQIKNDVNYNDYCIIQDCCFSFVLNIQKLLDCGEIVGVVQYFQHDLFRSMIRTLNFQKLHVVHQHYGRHSGVRNFHLTYDFFY